MVVDSPALALALVAAAVWCGAIIAVRRLALGALFAATASLTASLVIRQQGGIDGSVLFGRGVWLSLAELIPLGGLAAWSMRRLPPVTLVVVLTSLTTAVMAVSEWRERFEGNAFVNSILLVGLGGCIAAGALLRQSDRDRATAADRARQDERLAIARELHDVVAHHVTGIVVQAQAGQLVAPTDPVRAAGTLAGIERAGAEALASMRRMVGALRDPDESAAPTAPAATLVDLEQLVARSAELGLPVRLHVDVDRVPPDVAQSVHRIVRESLTNVQRHATGATAVDVHVVQGPSALTVAVVDDGQPRPASSGGFGLVGMAERVQALGGVFRAGPRPAPGLGWEVRVTVPLRAEVPR